MSSILQSAAKAQDLSYTWGGIIAELGVFECVSGAVVLKCRLQVVDPPRFRCLPGNSKSGWQTR